MDGCWRNHKLEQKKAITAKAMASSACVLGISSLQLIPASTTHETNTHLHECYTYCTASSSSSSSIVCGLSGAKRVHVFRGDGSCSLMPRWFLGATHNLKVYGNNKTSPVPPLALSKRSVLLTVALLDDLLNLDLSDTSSSIIAEYIWIGGSGLDIRSKARTLSHPVTDPKDLPKWNYDGSSTGQAPGQDSEVILYPQVIFKDPFRRGNNILVICDAYTPSGEAIPTNNRAAAARIFSEERVVDEEPWFGIEQEYTLLQKNVKWPLGWPVNGYPGPQGPYYCGVGADKAWGRDIVNAHYKACLYSGIKISGVNGEVMPGQWEFQVGPVVGIAAGDQIWAARYILERITEMADVVLSFDPKPILGDWNGAGAHTNYSTKSMRADGGYEVIKKAIDKMRARHKVHIAAYGKGNERRLTGKHETADINTFSWGVANRGASIRVGRDTEREGKGYLEDRRPASNMDPYVVTSLIAETTILFDPTK
ncbi:hypothetical protein O6H91_07G006500 [Diphasiastrum complanatum]|uniref:Uncharacterized protein n=1 Tax=Diphasiastrum complanatum TaxID=34168 RepID=A0ACC2D298_DIPCM|nr:hypothetical protein O6H91_07G006500 [Diphasiastrum complanatum]